MISSGSASRAGVIVPRRVAMLRRPFNSASSRVIPRPLALAASIFAHREVMSVMLMVYPE